MIADDVIAMNFIPLQDDDDEEKDDEKYADKEFGGKFGFSAEGRKRWLGARTGEILKRQKCKYEKAEIQKMKIYRSVDRNICKYTQKYRNIWPPCFDRKCLLADRYGLPIEDYWQTVQKIFIGTSSLPKSFEQCGNSCSFVQNIRGLPTRRDWQTVCIFYEQSANNL